MSASWRLFLVLRHLALVLALAPTLSRPRRMTHLPIDSQTGMQAEKHTGTQIQVTGRHTERLQCARNARKRRTTEWTRNRKLFPSKRSKYSLVYVESWLGFLSRALKCWNVQPKAHHLYAIAACTLVIAVFSSWPTLPTTTTTTKYL